MKKTVLFILAFFLLLNFTITAESTEKEAKEAFVLTFQTYFYCAFLMAYGQEFPGAVLDGDILTFTSFDLTQIENDEPIPYTRVSGELVASENKADGSFSMSADLILQGGPVTYLKWTMKDAYISSDVIIVDVNADGQDYHIDEATGM